MPARELKWSDCIHGGPYRPRPLPPQLRIGPSKLHNYWIPSPPPKRLSIEETVAALENQLKELRDGAVPYKLGRPKTRPTMRNRTTSNGTAPKFSSTSAEFESLFAPIGKSPTSADVPAGPLLYYDGILLPPHFQLDPLSSQSETLSSSSPVIPHIEAQPSALPIFDVTPQPSSSHQAPAATATAPSPSTTSPIFARTYPNDPDLRLAVWANNLVDRHAEGEKNYFLARETAMDNAWTRGVMNIASVGLRSGHTRKWADDAMWMCVGARIVHTSERQRRLTEQRKRRWLDNPIDALASPPLGTTPYYPPIPSQLPDDMRKVVLGRRDRREQRVPYELHKYLPKSAYPHLTSEKMLLRPKKGLQQKWWAKLGDGWVESMKRDAKANERKADREAAKRAEKEEERRQSEARERKLLARRKGNAWAGPLAVGGCGVNHVSETSSKFAVDENLILFNSRNNKPGPSTEISYHSRSHPPSTPTPTPTPIATTPSNHASTTPSPTSRLPDFILDNLKSVLESNLLDSGPRPKSILTMLAEHEDDSYDSKKAYKYPRAEAAIAMDKREKRRRDEVEEAEAEVEAEIRERKRAKDLLEGRTTIASNEEMDVDMQL